MLQSKTFVKKTKRGKILKVVREHYLREDIYSGTPLDPECDASAYKLSPDAARYLVLDTNVALHQMDFLEHPSVTDVVVPAIVLEEVRARNQAAFQRLKALTTSEAKRFYVFANENHKDTYIKQDPGETPNDRNDRAIRRTAEWYAQRLPGTAIVLLTDDAANRAKALAAGVEALSCVQYAHLRQDEVPELGDLVRAGLAAAGEEEGDMRGGRDASASKRSRIYEEHRPLSEVTAGIKAGRYLQGTLRVSRFHAWEGWISCEAVEQDVLLPGRAALNRAMDGDVVVVELLPESEWRAPDARIEAAEEEEEEAEGVEEGGAHIAAPVDDDEPVKGSGPSSSSAAAPSPGGAQPTGKVVGILKRNWRTRGYCGSLRVPKGKEGVPASALYPATGGAQSVLVCPVERRYPFVRIQTRQAATLADKRIVVAIDGWPADSLYPSGHYVRTLGAIGDRDTETEVLLLENDINTSAFTPAVHACVPPLPWRVEDEHVAEPGRADLRHLPVCSVDPPGCKDIDDALHVRALPNGNLELGVHIADVTNFVLPESAMDEEAARRATTVYLVQRRIDMLPKPLTEDICSLRGGVDRLAFSVIWEVDGATAEIKSTTFTKSVIRSRAALTYAEAQSRIDDPALHDELTLGLRELNRVAKLLRAARAARGALALASPEVRFEIDTETQDPLDVGMYQVREANQMVEEMMLLANCSVADATLRAFPACALLRRHEPPAPRAFEPLLRAAAAAGVAVDCATSLSLARSLDAAVRADDPYFNTLLRIVATRCMTQAQYFSSGELAPPEYHHYGLAAPIYTHFTSPIRRYADVIVHRVLMAALGLRPLPDSLRDRPRVAGVVDNLNLRHRNAQLAGRASVELHTLIFFRGRTVLADARVTRVRANGLMVFVPKYGIEGPVRFDPEEEGDGAPAFTYDEEKQRVCSADGGVAYTVFDPCAVQISVQETTGNRRALLLKLVDRTLLPDAERVKK